MTSVANSAKHLGSLALKGLIGVSAPAIIKGMVSELLYQPVKYKSRERRINVKLLAEMVDENANLWALFPKTSQDKAKKMLAQIGDLEWFTADWLVEAMKEDHPTLSSLCLGWRKAHNWLERQIRQIKADIE